LNVGENEFPSTLLWIYHHVIHKHYTMLKNRCL